MRIIAGSLGGRLFDSPHGHRTHPMSDKIRGALFSTLGDLHGLTVLDAFSGSGALGFEAISRGAAAVVAIENDRLAQRTIQENIRKLGLQKGMTLFRGGAGTWIESHSNSFFDIVLLDPPYDDLQRSVVARLARHTNKDGTLITSWPGSENLPGFEGFELVKQKSYGDAQLGYYKKIKTDDK